jgi:hypothetical protein
MSQAGSFILASRDDTMLWQDRNCGKIGQEPIRPRRERGGTPEQEGSTMGAEKILRNTGLLAASGVVALALAALPAAPGLDAGFLDLKAAQAKGNGGNGNGGGNGNSGNAGGHGNAGGQGNGQGNGVSVENNDLNAQSQGLTASSLEGLNAAHASVQGFANASEDSMVGAIRSAIQDAYGDVFEVEVEEDGLISTIEPDEVDEAVLTSILGIDGEALEAMKGLVDDKVDEPE